MWDNTERSDSADSCGFADLPWDYVAAVAVGVVLGAVGFIAALAIGIRVPGMWG